MKDLRADWRLAAFAIWLIVPAVSLADEGGDASQEFGAAPTAGRKADAGAETRTASRDLYLHELDGLQKTGHVLLDRRLQSLENRIHAARLLGSRYAHRHAVPFLLAVALNRHAETRLRVTCVEALSAIREPVVIDSLIDLLDDSEVAVAETANDRLYDVTGREPPAADQKLDPDPDSRSRQLLKEAWQNWRNAERDSAKYEARAIEALERLGGRITFAADRRGPVAVEVYFDNAATITDFEMSHLKELSSLERLYLDETPATDRGLAALAELENLHTLFLRDAEAMTDAGLIHLKGLDALRQLDLSRTKITDRGLAHLKGMETLESLNLFSTQITDAGLAHLKGLTALTSLILNRTQVSGRGLSVLERMPRIQKLGLSGCPVTDEGLANVARVESLRTLQLGATRISSSGLAHLKDLGELRELSLGSTRIGSPGLVHLKGLSNLEKLELHGTRIEDEGLGHLKQLTRLQEMDLSHTGITDAGLLALEPLKDLRALYLSSTRINDDGLAVLVHFKRLEVLNLSNTQMTDRGLVYLKELASLRRLDLINCDVSEDALKELRRTLPKLANLYGP